MPFAPSPTRWSSRTRRCPADHVTSDFRPVARWLGHRSGGSDESRVVAAGAASAFAGWPGRPVEGSPDRAERDSVPGPHRYSVA